MTTGAANKSPATKATTTIAKLSKRPISAAPYRVAAVRSTAGSGGTSAGAIVRTTARKTSGSTTASAAKPANIAVATSRGAKTSEIVRATM